MPRAIAKLGRRDLQQFDPLKTKAVIETLKAAIAYAHQMQQWDDGMEAAELMAKWQRDFVGWWDGSVGVRQSPGGKDRPSNADRRSMLSKDKAEAETKIMQQQVSRWRKGLKRPDYPARIFVAGHKKAMAGDSRRADLQTGEMEWFTPASRTTGFDRLQDAMGSAANGRGQD